MLVAAELIPAGDLRDDRQAGRAKRQHQLPGPERDFLDCAVSPRAVHDDDPAVPLADG
jgi:hypothetical protein